MMRRALIAAFLLLLVTNLASAQAHELSGWKLVWSDEFNYTGHPDPAKWDYEEGYVRHNELQYYTVRRLENARVDGWNLVIELRMEKPESFLPTHSTTNGIATRRRASRRATRLRGPTAGLKSGRRCRAARVPGRRSGFSARSGPPTFPGLRVPGSPTAASLTARIADPTTASLWRGKSTSWKVGAAIQTKSRCTFTGLKDPLPRRLSRWTTCTTSFTFMPWSGIPTTWTSSSTARRF